MNRDGDPDLSLHSVLAGAVERFDAKVLFDPFEKLVSQNQTKPGGAKKRRLHFKSKKVEMSLRSEEHTSELQSRLHLVCRLLLEKKNTTHTQHTDRVLVTPRS